jgi:hypothetical protein
MKPKSGSLINTKKHHQINAAWMRAFAAANQEDSLLIERMKNK